VVKFILIENLRGIYRNIRQKEKRRACLPSGIFDFLIGWQLTDAFSQTDSPENILSLCMAMLLAGLHFYLGISQSVSHCFAIFDNKVSKIKFLEVSPVLSK
jgi:hypothetical protein